MKLIKILTDREKQFLINNSVYEIFMENVVPTRLLTAKLDNFIDNCFCWVATPQGHYYWAALNEAWENMRETI